MDIVITPSTPGPSAPAPLTLLEYGETVQATVAAGPSGRGQRIADAPADEAHVQRHLVKTCLGDATGRSRSLHALDAINQVARH